MISNKIRISFLRQNKQVIISTISIIFHWRVHLKKRTQLKAALLLAATINVSYAAEVCFPPPDGTDFSDVLQCIQDGHDAQQQQIEAQQKQIDALKKENQRLANTVEAQRQEKQQL